MTRRDWKIAIFAERLACEFDDWTMAQCVVAAERILDNAEVMAFQLEAEAGLAEIPVYVR